MDDSLFGKLPAELRIDVYERVLLIPGDITIDVSTGKPRIHRPPLPRNLLALTFTCKEIRSETLPIFYSTYVFHLRPRVALALPITPISAITPTGTPRQLRTIDRKREAHEHRFRPFTKWSGVVENWLQRIGARNRACLRHLDIVIGRRMVVDEHSELCCRQSIQDLAYIVSMIDATRTCCTISLCVDFENKPPGCTIAPLSATLPITDTIRATRIIDELVAQEEMAIQMARNVQASLLHDHSFHDTELLNRTRYLRSLLLGVTNMIDRLETVGGR